MKQYEIMLLFDVQITEEERTEKIDTIKTAIKSGKESEVLKTVDLGIKQLAYPINKRTNGYYYLIYFESNPALIAKINTKIKYLEDILRFLIVESDEDLNAAKEDEALKVKKIAEQEAKKQAELEAKETGEKASSEEETEEVEEEKSSDEANDSAPEKEASDK
jgi:small subunit ribosomal protein S6